MADTSKMTGRDGVSWESMWAAGLAPGDKFDATAPHPALVDLLQSDVLPGGAAARALVPGCGRGYEVCALAASGKYGTVVGLDLAPTGVEAARAHAAAVGGAAVERVEWACGDFFAYDGGPGFRLVVDYTFLCALPVEMRADWARKMAELVEVGGVLLTLIFPLLKRPEEGGPPHGVTFELFETLLTGVGFQPIEHPNVLVRKLCALAMGWRRHCLVVLPYLVGILGLGFRTVTS